MKWTQDLSVGVEIIDEQHKELFERINALVQAIKEHRCKSEIAGTIQFLEDYAVKHFGTEESRMKEFAYPDYEHHRQQHIEFIDNINELRKGLEELQAQQLKGSSYDLSATTNQVVVDWILDHIAKIDKKLGEFLKSRA